MNRATLSMLLAAFLVSYAQAHSGRTDSNGGHYNRKTGGYHFHGGGGGAPRYNPPPPKPTYRSSARTSYKKTPRITYRRQAVRSVEEDTKPKRAVSQPKPKLTPRFVAHFTSKRGRPTSKIVSYTEENDRYLLKLVSGGYVGYRKQAIEKFEPIPGAPKTETPQAEMPAASPASAPPRTTLAPRRPSGVSVRESRPSQSVRGPPSRAQPGLSVEKVAEVYATRTGKKYHRAGCRYLRLSKIPMELSAARQRYTPCSVCKPPE